MGGYDGTSTTSPEDVAKAIQEMEEVAAKLEGFRETWREK